MHWKQIIDPTSIEEVQSFFQGFHDSYLAEVHYCSSSTIRGPRLSVSDECKPLLRLFFQGGGVEFRAIELLFVGSINAHIGDDGFWDSKEQIDEAWIHICPDKAVWTTIPNFLSKTTHTGGLWCESERLYWRDVSSWDDSRLRYLDPELEVVQGADLP